jgi:hypothetical protein
MRIRDNYTNVAMSHPHIPFPRLTSGQLASTKLIEYSCSTILLSMHHPSSTLAFADQLEYLLVLPLRAPKDQCAVVDEVRRHLPTIVAWTWRGLPVAVFDAAHGRRMVVSLVGTCLYRRYYFPNVKDGHSISMVSITIDSE